MPFHMIAGRNVSHAHMNRCTGRNCGGMGKQGESRADEAGLMHTEVTLNPAAPPETQIRGTPLCVPLHIVAGRNISRRGARRALQRIAADWGCEVAVAETKLDEHWRAIGRNEIRDVPGSRVGQSSTRGRVVLVSAKLHVDVRRCRKREVAQYVYKHNSNGVLCTCQRPVLPSGISLNRRAAPHI